ncbi:MAG: ABC transporter permease [Geovibrio sp.]|nr:ABC transporter permease [Geovibrio sp.]
MPDSVYLLKMLSLVSPAVWETLYMVAASGIMAYIIGLPLGIYLVVSSKGHILPNPLVEKTLGTVINILRSAPFIVLMVALIPFTRAVVGTSIGTTAAIVPLVISTAPFVARIVETSLKEVPAGVIEAAQSMGASPPADNNKGASARIPKLPDSGCCHHSDQCCGLHGNGRRCGRRRSG